MNVEEILKQKDESFDKWFDRWYQKSNLENKIKISASKGYSGLNIAVSKEEDEYTKRRLSNPKVIVKLKEKLIGFEIKYEENYGERTIFGQNLGTWYTKVISISWKEAK